MAESFRTRLYRWGLNLFPTIRRSSGNVTYLADDYREIHVKLSLNMKRRNYVGSIFGGSIFASVDPYYMFMFTKVLGPEYIVWDKAATTHFIKTGGSTLFAEFNISQAEIDSIKAELAEKGKIEREYHVGLVDKDGEVCATLDKTIYFQLK